MKKCTIFLLLLVYALSSTGTTINLHYCCGKLEQISFSTLLQQGCDKNQPGFSKERCCDNKHLEFKIKADQEPAAKWLQAQKVLSAPVPVSNVVEYFYVSKVPVNERSTGPPEPLAVFPLFIKYRVFRI